MKFVFKKGLYKEAVYSYILKNKFYKYLTVSEKLLFPDLIINKSIDLSPFQIEIICFNGNVSNETFSDFKQFKETTIKYTKATPKKLTLCNTSVRR